MRRQKLAVLSCMLYQAVLLFSLVSLYVVFYNQQWTDLHRQQEQVQDPQHTPRQWLTLDHFDILLSKSKERLVNLTFSSDHDLEENNWNLDKKSGALLSYSMMMDQNLWNAFFSLVKQDLELQSAPSFLQSEPIINDHRFFYVHNPHRTCAQSQTEVLLTVPSAVGNFENRQKVRNGSTGQYVRQSGNKIKLVFFLGRPSQDSGYSQIQEKIDAEANIYGDIVQENFEDVYHNIRYKAVSMLKWASTFCPQTKYVIRSDDDVKINLTNLVAVLHRTREKFQDFILGVRRVGDKPKRTTYNKYYLSEREYPAATFPPYVLGGLLGYPIHTVRVLYQAALRLKPIWLDDVYITGLCAAKVKVPVLQDREFTFEHRKW